jgi:hypothetical protein
MPFKHTWTQCVVRLLALRGLSLATLDQCQALRHEAGACGWIWSPSMPRRTHRGAG